LQDKVFASDLGRARVAKLRGEALRKALVEVAEKRFTELSKQVQKATRLF
jgi:hypothetical protein